ncbi:MAG: hypothetical protein ACP6IU_08720 [Candidatus Asgardarchaeia archaeon]
MYDEEEKYIKILDKLNAYVKEVIDILQIEFAVPKIQKIITQQNIVTSKYRFGGFLKNETLLIDEKMINSVFIDAILAREAFLHVFNTIVYPKSNIQIILDLAMEFGRIKINNKKIQRQWIDIWKEAWYEIRSHANNKITEELLPFEIFPRYDEITACKFLYNLSSTLLLALLHKLKLTNAQYVQLIDEALITSPIHLRPIEVLVLSEIVKDFRIDVNSLAKKLKLNLKIVKDTINNLLRKQIIAKSELIHFKVLKLEHYILFINTTKQLMNEVISNLKLKNPYIYATFRFYGQHSNFAIIFLGPANQKFRILLRMFTRRLNDMDEISRAEFYRRDEWDKSYNFSYYNVNKKRWEIDWSSWFYLSKKRLEREQYIDTFTRPFMKLEDSPTPVEIKQQDLKILNLLTKFSKVPISKIQKNLKIRTNTIIERLKYMRKNNILTPVISIGYIGLPEIVALIVNVNSSDVLHYKSILDTLPATLTVRTTLSKPTLQSAIFLPLGESTLFSYYAHKLFSFLDLDFRMMFSSILLLERYWKIPVELWDEDKQDWIVPEDIFAPIV